MSARTCLEHTQIKIQTCAKTSQMTVVASAEASPDQDRVLGHLCTGHGHHHLGAVLGDARGLVLLADHEAGDVLQEHQRDATL